MIFLLQVDFTVYSGRHCGEIFQIILFQPLNDVKNTLSPLEDQYVGLGGPKCGAHGRLALPPSLHMEEALHPG